MENIHQQDQIIAFKKAFGQKLHRLFQNLPQQNLHTLIQSLVDNCIARSYAKNEFIGGQETPPEGYLYYIQSGIAGASRGPGRKKKRNISGIYTKDTVIFDPAAYFIDSRKQFIHMLEPGNILLISYDTLRSLADEHPLMISMLQVALQLELENYIELLKLSTDNKVRVFLEAHPAIIARLNNQDIADHLDVSRCAFSNTRTKHRKDREGS